MREITYRDALREALREEMLKNGEGGMTKDEFNGIRNGHKGKAVYP